MQESGDSYNPTSDNQSTKTVPKRTVEVAVTSKDGIHPAVTPGSPLSEITDDRSEVEQEAASLKRNFTIKNRTFAIIEYTSSGASNRNRDVFTKWRECELSRKGWCTNAMWRFGSRCTWMRHRKTFQSPWPGRIGELLEVGSGCGVRLALQGGEPRMNLTGFATKCTF